MDVLTGKQTDALNYFFTEQLLQMFNPGNGLITIVSGTTHATPGTEVAIPIPDLGADGRIPTGFIITYQDKAGTVYAGTTANTATELYVVSDVASVTFKAIPIFKG